MRSLRHCLLFPIAAIVLVHCSAQSPTSPSGTVFDPSGATVQGCALQLASTEGVLLQQTTTDLHGVFHLKSLAPGDYILVIPADHGFAADTLPIHITGGKMPSLDVHLRLPEVNEKVDVADDSSAVSTDPGTNSDQVTASAPLIEKIPVLNQDVISTFTPFLSQTGVNSKGVTLVVDGIETKSSGVSVSAIKSVSINNDPYTAEARSPGKGRIEILTKAGTPKFHGTFNFTFRDASTDAITPFAIAPPVEQRRIYEGNITGPLGRGSQTTFLISGTRQEDNLQSIVNQRAILAAALPGIVTNIDTPTHTTLLAARVARDLSANHRVSLQYNVEDVITRNQGVGGLVLGDTGVNTQSREDDIVFNDSYTVSPSIVNQLQLFFEKDHNPVRSVVDAQKVIVDGTFTSGGAQADVLDTENNLKINEIVSWNKGRHFVKAGIVIPNLSRRAWEDHGNRLGTFKFASLDAYNAKLPYAFTQQAGPGRAVFWANEIGVFALDQIQLKPNLQMSLGIRYDWQTYFDSPHNFSPRFSIAYSPGKQRTSILRVGAGVFYDRAGARPISDLKRFNGTVLRAITILNPDYTNPIPPGQSIATLPTDLVTTAPDASIPLLTYFSVGVDHQLAKGTSIAFTYRGNLGFNLFRSADVNAPPGPAYLTRPNPAFGVVRQIQTRGRQVSNALDITFKGTAGRWFNGLAQYTLSHTENNTGGIAWFPANQYDDSGEYAPADFDQLQRFNLLGTFNEGHWLSLGLAANIYSGTPYTETSGVDTFNTGILNARPAGIGRNTLTTAGYANLDLRWSHDFALTRAHDKAPTATFAVDAFNSLNRTNYSAYVGNIQSQFFEEPTSALPARRIQFTVRLKF
jgi:Carboxypeptidase regulatory-like domain